VYLDIGDDVAIIQVVMEYENAEIIRDTIYLPIGIMPGIANAISKYFAGSRKLEIVT
jgi:hypothetical protein